MATKQDKMISNAEFESHIAVVFRFTTLLGAFRLKNLPKEKAGNNDGSISTLFSLEPGAQCSTSSLSLLSSKFIHNHETQENRHEVEEYVAFNLARPLFAKNGNSGTNSTQDHSRGEFESLPIHKLPHAILNNLAESFLTLIDARLRAYITILARHGISLSECPASKSDKQNEGVIAIEKKVNALIDVGAGVVIENIVTLYNLEDPTEEGTKHGNPYEFNIVMGATMDVSIPAYRSDPELVTVRASTKGHLKVSFDDIGLLYKVNIELDTHRLLSDLVDRASLIISKVLENVRAFCASSKIDPPASVHGHLLREEPVKEHVLKFAIVSPDITPRREEFGVEPLQLDLIEKSADSLSPQSCASIVDFVIGEVDWKKDVASTESKKQRSTT